MCSLTIIDVPLTISRTKEDVCPKPIVRCVHLRFILDQQMCAKKNSCYLSHKHFLCVNLDSHIKPKVALSLFNKKKLSLNIIRAHIYKAKISYVPKRNPFQQLLILCPSPHQLLKTASIELDLNQLVIDFIKVSFISFVIDLCIKQKSTTYNQWIANYSHKYISQVVHGCYRLDLLQIDSQWVTLKRKAVISRGERPFIDILQDRRYWVIHLITIPSLFLAGVIFILSGFVYKLFGVANFNQYFYKDNTNTQISLINDRFSILNEIEDV